MSPASPTAPRRRSAPGLAAAIAVAAALAQGGRAAAEGFAGRASVGWDELRAPEVRTSGLTQRYELSYWHDVSPRFLSYRLSLFASAQDGFQRAGAFDTRTASKELQPRLFLSSRSEVHAATLSYDASLSRSEATSAEVAHSLVQRFYGTGEARADPAWPRLTASAGHQRRRSLDSGEEAYSSVVDGNLAQGIGHFTWSAGASWRNSSSNTSDASHDVYMPRAALGWEAPLGRASLGASYSVSYIRTELRSPGAASAQAIFLSPTRALYGQNPLPGDDSGRPLAPAAALTDGNLEVPTGIALGLDGSSFQNMALDMGQFLAVDEIDVVVRNGSGFLVPFGGPVSFSAWSSPDGILWEPILGVSSSFDAVQSKYVIRFPPATSRSFKVVSLGLNDTPTYATEVQAFEHRTVVGRRTLVDGSVAHVANARLGIPLASKISSSADANVVYGVTGLHTGGSTPEHASWQGGAGLQFGPFGVASYGLAHRRAGVLLAAGPRAESDTTIASTSLAFLPGLEAHASADLSNHRVQEIHSTSTGVSAGTSARPSRFASLTLDGGVGRQEVEPTGTRSTYWSAAGTSNLVLTRSLQLQLQASTNQGRVRIPSPSGLNPISQTTNYRQFIATAGWSPSPYLQANGSVIYQDTGTASGLLQAYRIYWYPLPGGAFSLNVSFDQSFDTTTDTRSSRATATAHWQINGHTSLDGVYSTVGNQERRLGEFQQFGAAFSLSL